MLLQHDVSLLEIIILLSHLAPKMLSVKDIFLEMFLKIVHHHLGSECAIHYINITWASWRLKSPADGLFVQQSV